MTTQPQPEALLPLPEAEAWVISLDCDMRGFMDAKAWKEDEFTTPLFTADQMRAYATEHAARLHAECEALRAAFNAACAFIDCHVGDWDLTKEMVSKHAAFVKARAELAARAAKEQA